MSKKESFSIPVFSRVTENVYKSLKKAFEQSDCETMAQFLRKILTDFVTKQKKK